MTSDVWFAGGLLFALLIALCILGRKRKRSCEYDEMQQLIRGRAYRFGFFATLLFGMCAIIGGGLGLYRFAAPSFCFFAAMFGGIIAFAVYAILHGAYLKADESFRSRASLFALVIACNLLVVVFRAIDGDLFEDGVLTLASAAPLLMVLGFAATLAALFIARARAKKEAEE